MFFKCLIQECGQEMKIHYSYGVIAYRTQIITINNVIIINLYIVNKFNGAVRSHSTP